MTGMKTVFESCSVIALDAKFITVNIKILFIQRWTLPSGAYGLSSTRRDKEK